ncbi:hypothetical protein B0J14DRAFT_141354 [Halenospora varia]|nr:hypothetical protein B0J14DRAFT_141354 [Halenospora varia]
MKDGQQMLKKTRSVLLTPALQLIVVFQSVVTAANLVMVSSNVHKSAWRTLTRLWSSVITARKLVIACAIAQPLDQTSSPAAIASSQVTVQRSVQSHVQQKVLSARSVTRLGKLFISVHIYGQPADAETATFHAIALKEEVVVPVTTVVRRVIVLET